MALEQILSGVRHGTFHLLGKLEGRQKQVEVVNKSLWPGSTFEDYMSAVSKSGEALGYAQAILDLHNLIAELENDLRVLTGQRAN